MNKTLITIIAAIFAAVSISTANAQAAGPQGGAPTVQNGGAKAGARAGHAGGGIKRVMTALEKLKLTDQQKTDVKALATKAETDVKAVAAKVKAGTETKEQAKPEMQAIVKTFRQGLAKILTKDQQKELAAELKKERGGAKGAKGGTNGKGAGTPPPSN
jgi:Spy/CpxP family protein refolding chaperone